MNIRQGMFRLWVIASVLFVIAVGVSSYSGIRQEFKDAYTDWDAVVKEYGGYTLYPTDCEKARGTAGTDYSVSKELCWYRIEDFRRLFPEYNNVSDRVLDQKLYAKVGQPIQKLHPWVKLMETVAVAVAVPLAVFALGWSLFWAFAGFRGSSSDKGGQGATA